MAKNTYANPEVLVTTQWVEDHLTDPKVRIVESDEDILLFEIGHIPGAIALDWHTDFRIRLSEISWTKPDSKR